MGEYGLECLEEWQDGCEGGGQCWVGETEGVVRVEVNVCMKERDFFGNKS